MANFTTLVDQFPGTTLNTSKWNKVKYSTGVATVNNKLTLLTSGGSDSYIAVNSVSYYTLEANYLYFQSEVLSNILSVSVGDYPNDIRLSITYNSVTFTLGATTGTYTLSSAKCFHRLREDSGTVYYDVSINGASYTNLASAPIGLFDATSALLSFSVSRNTIDPQAVIYAVNAIPYTSYNLSISGTLKYGGDVVRKVIANRSISGTLIFGGDITLVRHGQTNALAKKSFLVKSYDEDGVFQNVLDDVISEFTYTQEINSSSSSIELLLSRNSDSRAMLVSPILDSDGINILDSNSRQILGNSQSLPRVGPGSDINYNNRIDVWAFYGSIEPILDSLNREILDSNGETIDSVIGAPNGIRKFTGYISQINTQYGNEENTSITITSYGADLKNYLVNDGAGSTTVAFNSYDPGNIIKDSLDRFKADAILYDELTYTDYTDSTVELTSTVASYTFKANNQQDMADKALELAPAEQYYYIDLGTNLYHFHQRSVVAEHVFYLGKHIESLSLRSGIENSASQFLGVGGGDPALYKYYNRTRAPYTRRGLIQYSDSRVTLEGSLDIISEYELDAKNRVQYKTAINILDRAVDGEKGYPIDSVVIGDTVGFRNFGNYVDELIFQIVGLTYEADRINLQLDTLSPTVSKRLADIRRNLDQQQSQYVPADPLV